MADRTVPRLPKLPELTKLQALLLLGGAFVFGMGVWAACRYDLFLDRSPSAPASAVFAATIDRAAPEWPALEARLPEGARQALAVAGDIETPTLFAVRDAGGGLAWSTVEALSSVTERTGSKRMRLAPKGTVAVGTVTLGGRKAPFEARLGGGFVHARVGTHFRGPTFRSNPFTEGRRLKAPIHQQAAYIEKPEGASWKTASSVLGGALQRFQPLATLWNLPGRLELAVSASETPVLSPFVLYYRPAVGGSLEGPVIEEHAKYLLAEAEPVGFKVMLPDATGMTELRREPDAVTTVRKPVHGFGTRAQLRLPGSLEKMEIFYADDGETWLSTDLGLIQASIMGNIDASAPVSPCEKGGEDGFAALSGAFLSNSPYFNGFERLTISLHSVESGMFTTCGYLAP